MTDRITFYTQIHTHPHFIIPITYSYSQPCSLHTCTVRYSLQPRISSRQPINKLIIHSKKNETQQLRSHAISQLAISSNYGPYQACHEETSDYYKQLLQQIYCKCMKFTIAHVQIQLNVFQQFYSQLQLTIQLRIAKELS